MGDNPEHNGNDPKTSNTASNGDRPEPPDRYNPNTNVPYGNPQGNDESLPEVPSEREYEDTRRLVLASQIMAGISFVIGGVVLSCAALVVAVLAYRRIAKQLVEVHGPTDRVYWQLLKRSGIIALVLSAFAVAINVAAAIYVYPIVMDMLLEESTATLPASTSIWG